ncbi:hypothetical protein D3C85_1688050 [compost metagenome]
MASGTRTVGAPIVKCAVVAGLPLAVLIRSYRFSKAVLATLMDIRTSRVNNRAT